MKNKNLKIWRDTEPDIHLKMSDQIESELKDNIWELIGEAYTYDITDMIRDAVREDWETKTETKFLRHDIRIEQPGVWI